VRVMKITMPASHNENMRREHGVFELFRPNQADQVRYVLRIRRHTKRRPAPELHREQSLLHANHADILPGYSQQHGGCIFDPHRKGFVLTTKHNRTLPEDRLPSQSGDTPMTTKAKIFCK